MSAPPSFSHYPSHPPPVRVSLHVSAPHACAYFADRKCTTRALWTDRADAEVYHRFMDAGFRRSGRILYQPVCAGCRLCQPLRVPVAEFAASKSQRRAWRRNQDLLVSVAAPEPTPEKLALYNKYRRLWHDSTDEQTWEDFTSFLYDSPVDTIEVCYRDPTSDRILGVGICDVAPESLSAVYFYFDPDHAARRLGTFSALWEIETARRLAVPWYYLGFWVPGCRAMEYKADFRPCEVLGTDGTWRRLEVPSANEEGQSHTSAG
ncbi:MAG: arginyltransferase [Phycisphaerae bacterium]|nr:arginyltransferase [Tepidisphaeraceae bacterium]